VVDITHTNAQAQAEAVHQTLEEIEADHIPVLTVLNKIDLLEEPQKAQKIVEDFPNAAALSALKGDGIGALLEDISGRLYETFNQISVKLPYKEGGLISLFHKSGQVEKVHNLRGGVIIQGRIPVRLQARFQSYVIDQKEESNSSK
jgi:GTP-binding protein HflX